eukprot:scaffold9246_cov58-Phaeocystis_antarctica.AAC.1
MGEHAWNTLVCTVRLYKVARELSCPTGSAHVSRRLRVCTCTSLLQKSCSLSLVKHPRGLRRLDPSPHSHAHGPPTRAPTCSDERGGAKARSQGAGVAPSAHRHRSEDTPGAHESSHGAP